MLETNPCEENHQTDFAGNDSIRKVHGFFVFVDRQFSHRGADGGRSTKPLDEPGKLIAASTLQGADAKALEIRFGPGGFTGVGHGEIFVC